MAVRKVLNKHVPWDFDPARLPKGRVGGIGRLAQVRMMLPCSVRCRTCGEFSGAGTKFNSKKEVVAGETYHGLRVWRFYGKCKNCSAVFTLKTDPGNDDYVVESGATRNFELWRAERDAAAADAAATAVTQPQPSRMNRLEQRALESHRHEDVNNALEGIQSLNARASSMDPQALIRRLHDNPREGSGATAAQAVPDEVRRMFRKRRAQMRAQGLSRATQTGTVATASAGGGAGSGDGISGAGGTRPARRARLVAPLAAQASAPHVGKTPQFTVRKRRTTAAREQVNSSS